MKFKVLFCLTILFSLSAFPGNVKTEIKAIPTFESCGIYISGDSVENCNVYYKKAGDQTWNQSFFPVYDSVENEYRVSIVRLSENCRYDVKAVLKNKGTTQEYTTQFATWSSHLPVAREIKISSFKKNKDGSIYIANLQGTPDGWIRVIGNEPIRAGADQEAALLLTNCRYVIFERLNVKGGYRHGIKTNETVSDIRFINCEISKWGRPSNRQDKKGHYLDKDGKEINNDGGFTIYKSKNIVLERSYIHDPNGFTNPWNGIVEHGEYKGTPYIFTHPQGPNAVYIMESKGGVVLRYNDLVGSQTHRYNDPVEAWQNRDINGGFARDADIYGNVMAFGQDDAIELDGGQCNVRLYDNRMEQTYCGVSTAPNKKGPSYIFNNIIWNMGNSLGRVGNAIKNGGGFEHTRGIQFLFNNTIIHDGGGMIGVGYGNGDQRELFYAYTRNNIFYSQRPDNDSIRKGYCINDLYRIPQCDFDYDMLGNSTHPEGKGGIVAVEGAEKNGIYASPKFSDMAHGVLTLSKSDPGIGKGQFLYNFTATSKSYRPSLGAFQPGALSLMPMRPLEMEADKYYIKLKTGKTGEITIKVGNQPASPFSIRMAEDMENWLTIETSEKEIKPNSILKLKLKASTVPYKRNGMIFIRLDNGLSLPVTVVAED